MNQLISTKSPERIEVSARLRTVYTDVLNELHDTEYSTRFWGLLIEDYIRSVLTLKPVLENGHQIEIRADKYPVNSHTVPGFKVNLKQDLKQFLKFLETRGSVKEANQLLLNHDSFRFGFPFIDNGSLNRLGIEMPTVHLYRTGGGDRKLRKKLITIAERFDDPFLKRSVMRLPKIFVEYFDALCDTISLIDPLKKTFHVHNVETLYERLMLAKYSEHGAKLVWYQHGSHYGEYTHEYLHHLEHSFADEYRTWGWKIMEKDRPWKAYRLEQFRREYEQHTSGREIDLLICYPKMYDKYRNQCSEVSDAISEQLNFDKYPDLLARPRPAHRKYGHEKELVDFIGDERIKISTGLSPISQDVKNSRLVIQVNVPATNFLECIYVDHPTMGLLRNTQPTDIIKPFYDFFLEKGVLHMDAESLIQHLNRINIEDWWKEIVKKETFQIFKSKFANNI